jgi:hypothetical protein
MIPKITVFLSTPSTKQENDIVKRFLELDFAPLIDAHHKKSYEWFLNNVKPVPHKLFSFEKQNVYFYEVDDLHDNMDFTPNVLIHWNEGDIIEEEKWRWIREWLVYKFYTCYDYLDYMNDEIFRADFLMKRPDRHTVSLSDKEPVKEQNDESYSFQTHFIEDKNTMLYEVKKPHTDLPYTSVIRNFSERGHKAFFPTLYVCQSWGVSRHDLSFLAFMWKQLNLEEEFDMDAMLKEATEKCYPSKNGPPEPEPEVYRRGIPDVLATLQFQQDGIECGHNFATIPKNIKDRF